MGSPSFDPPLPTTKEGAQPPLWMLPRCRPGKIIFPRNLLRLPHGCLPLLAAFVPCTPLYDRYRQIKEDRLQLPPGRTSPARQTHGSPPEAFGKQYRNGARKSAFCSPEGPRSTFPHPPAGTQLLHHRYAFAHIPCSVPASPRPERSNHRFAALSAPQSTRPAGMAHDRES